MPFKFESCVDCILRNPELDECSIRCCADARREVKRLQKELDSLYTVKRCKHQKKGEPCTIAGGLARNVGACILNIECDMYEPVK